MISPLRQKLFNIFASYYEEYGIPGLCGWIDTLFLLEPQHQNDQHWTQKIISKRLTDFFPNGKYPTSVSSVNRAIRINEKYGTVLKKGTHKTGYTYTATLGTEMIAKIFEGFIEKTNLCLNELQLLSDECQDTDPILNSILEEQIVGYHAYVQLLEYALDFFKEEYSKMDPTGGE